MEPFVEQRNFSPSIRSAWPRARVRTTSRLSIKALESILNGSWKHGYYTFEILRVPCWMRPQVWFQICRR